jgi:DNA-binding transcriptional regulator YiaG
VGEYEYQQAPLYDSGVGDKRTLRELDKSNLSPVPTYSSGEIRDNEGVRQTVFVNYLNVNKSLVYQWERGGKETRRPILGVALAGGGNGLEAIR